MILTTEVYAEKAIGVDREQTVEFRTGKVFRDSNGRKMQQVVKGKAKSKGYYVFICPNCDGRNKRAVAKGKELKDTEAVAFICAGCHKHVPVNPPLDLMKGVLEHG